MTMLLMPIITMMFMSFSCSESGNYTASLKTENQGTDSVLIVYLSRTKNTQAVAKMIQETAGGTLMELEVQNPYPKDYKAIVAQVQQENETGFLPELKTKIGRMDSYNRIFIGFPTWGMQLPPPMKSFLKSYDLKGKTIIPFNSNAGYGVGSGFETVKELCPDSQVLEGFSVEGGKERDGILFVMQGEKEKRVKVLVGKWLQKLGFEK